jgi:hypothetical protein
MLRQTLKTALRHGWLDRLPDFSEPYRSSPKISHRAWFSPEDTRRSTKRHESVHRSQRKTASNGNRNSFTTMCSLHAVRPFERLRSRLRPARVYDVNTPTKMSVTSAVLNEQWRTPGPTDLIFLKWQRELLKTILDETKSSL